MDILKILARFNVQVVLCLAGIVAIYFGIFSDLPNSSNSFKPTLRVDLIITLLLIGGVMIMIGCALLMYENKNQYAVTLDMQWTGSPDKHPLVVKWWKSSSTQKEVVAFLYEESHRNSISLDKFYDAFCKKNGSDAVGSIDELYFRLKTLETAGFLHIESIGPKVTNIVKRQYAKLALRDGDILKSGG